MLNVFLEGVKDPIAREALIRISEFLKSFPFASGNWLFFEIPLKIGDNSVNHSLGIKPRDLLILSQTGQSDLTVKYSEFTSSKIKINSTQPTTIRFLVGSYEA